MSGDGAHIGVGAGRALESILGGAPAPGADEQDDAAAVRRRILAAASRLTSGESPAGYGDCADMVAGLVLRFYETRPESFDWPASGKPDLYAEVNQAFGGKISDLGITGFQWGWAVNAARFTESLPPEPNPAILALGPADEDGAS